MAYGKPFIASPDLTTRFDAGTPLNAWTGGTFHTEGAGGYTDYPAPGQVAGQAVA